MYWKLFAAVTYLLGWYGRASVDGKITLVEWNEGLMGALNHAGIEFDVEVAPPPGGPVPPLAPEPDPPYSVGYVPRPSAELEGPDPQPPPRRP